MRFSPRLSRFDLPQIEDASFFIMKNNRCKHIKINRFDIAYKFINYIYLFFITNTLHAQGHFFITNVSHAQSYIFFFHNWTYIYFFYNARTVGELNTINLYAQTYKIILLLFLMYRTRKAIFFIANVLHA